MSKHIKMHHPKADKSIIVNPGQIENMKANGWIEGEKPKKKELKKNGDI